MRKGAVRLASALERLGVQATFLFSLGPDHTGRALKACFVGAFSARCGERQFWSTTACAR